VGVFLGLLSSLTYGTVDFLGGLLTRRAGVFAVALLSQAFGTVLLLPLVPLVGGDPTARALVWGGAAGVGGGLGVTLLYRGLALGRMSVVAPVVAVIAASVPVAAGLGLGERPGAPALGGVGLALIAVAMIASSPQGGGGPEGEPVEGGSTVAAVPVLPAGERRPGPGRSPRGVAAGLVEALVAGVLLGGYLVAIARAGDGTGLWPVAAARITSICAIGAIALAARRPIAPPRRLLRAIAVVGVLDMAANVLYLLAVRRGLLSLIGVLSSLYPASTLVLARIVLRERLGRLQSVGLAVAAAGVVLIAAG
jgi:drug/metabolite transporter (DMT)-like permease